MLAKHTRTLLQQQKARLTTGLLLALLFLALGSLCRAGAAQEQAKEKAKPAEQPATYVGSETCDGCHEDFVKAFKKNPHQAVETSEKRGWKGKSCESCHGPGTWFSGRACSRDRLETELGRCGCFRVDA